MNQQENKTEIIILDEWVKVTWAGRNITYYQDLGYEYTGYHDKFWCHISDLSHGANVDVLVRCPQCEQDRAERYGVLIARGHSFCISCSGNARSFKDLSGQIFGRLTAIKPTDHRSGTSVVWVCQCECGNVHFASRHSLTRGSTTSCGCYKLEILRSVRGEDHHLWNPNITDEERMIGRNTSGNKRWVSSVLKRDNYTCQRCGHYSGNLEAHHLYSYKKYRKYRTKLWNGVTLCKYCHRDFHINFMGGWQIACTKEDYDEWIENQYFPPID